MINQCEQYLPRMIAHRRHLHANAEMSFKEFETKKYICSVLDEIGLEYQTFEGNCAVLAKLKGDKPGKTIAFRADIDALGICEENTFEHRSKNEGVMHACGHDAHASVLLAFCELLSKNKDKVSGEVRFIFQHAEETLPGGANELVQLGVLDGVDYVYGAHTNTSLQVGQVGFITGPAMAAADGFVLEFSGMGGHGSRPHVTQDVILAASHAVVSLQSIVARFVDPLKSAVVSVCTFHSGTLFNAFPTSATVKGTIRTFDDDVRWLVKKKIGEVAQASADMFGAKLDYTHNEGYPALVNDKELVLKVKAEAEKNGIEMVEVERSPGGEDFAYFAQTVPGAFFFPGCRLKDQKPAHSPLYDLDEKGMLFGLKTFVCCL